MIPFSHLCEANMTLLMMLASSPDLLFPTLLFAVLALFAFALAWAGGCRVQPDAADDAAADWRTGELEIRRWDGGMQEAGMFAELMFAEYGDSPPISYAELESMFNSHEPEIRYDAVLASLGGEIVGFAVWAVDGDARMLLHVLVTAKQRRRGIARLLLLELRRTFSPRMELTAIVPLKSWPVRELLDSLDFVLAGGSCDEVLYSWRKPAALANAMDDLPDAALAEHLDRLRRRIA